MASYTPAEEAAKAAIGTYNDNPYDPVTNQGGFPNNGHRQNFNPALDNTVIMVDASLRFADEGQASANAAQAAATSASADWTGTSTTSLTIGTGSQALTIETGKAFVAGQTVSIVDNAAPSTNFMRGTITSYDGGTGALVVDVLTIGGSGTLSAWTVSIFTGLTSSPTETGEQLDYSADTNIPDSFVVSLNPDAGGLVATLSSTDEGDIKRLINISAFDAIVKLSGTGFLTLPASETAYVMRVGSDWFVTKSANESLPSSLISFGAGEVFESASTSEISVISLSSTKIAIAYRDSGNSSFGTAVIGDISGSSITFGTAQVFNSAQTTDISCVALDSSKIVISYKDFGNSNFGTSIVGDISGTVITFGSEYVFNSGNTVQISGDNLSSTKFVLGYQDAATGDGESIIGDVSGTVITFGIPYTFNPALTSNISCAALDSSKLVISYQDTGNSSHGTAIIGDVSGTVITFGSEYVFNAASTSTMSVSMIDSNKFIIVYKDTGNSEHGTAIVGDVSGTVITFGSEYVFNAASTDYPTSSVLSSSIVSVSYKSSSFGRSRVLTVSGNSISSSSDENIFNSATTNFISSIQLDSSKFAVAYQDGGNSSFGTAKTGEVLTA